MGRELVCVGLTTLDVVARPVNRFPEDALDLVEQIVLAPAGTAAGTAYIAATLGVQTAVASQIGRDGAGHSVRALLQERGADTQLLATHPSMSTSTTLILVRPSGDRTRFHALGASMTMTISPALLEAVRSAKFVHYAGIGGANTDGGPGVEMLAQAKRAGAIITCDLISPGPKAAEELQRLLPYVDYFMPNASEAVSLSNTSSLEDAARAFMAMGARACILKDGPSGSLFVQANGAQRFPAHVIEPQDTTSCGDSYCAGFIAARLRGQSEANACRFGTAVAAQVALDAGTLGVLDSYDSTMQFMLRTPLHST